MAGKGKTHACSFRSFQRVHIYDTPLKRVNLSPRREIEREIPTFRISTSNKGHDQQGNLFRGMSFFLSTRIQFQLTSGAGLYQHGHMTNIHRVLSSQDWPWRQGGLSGASDEGIPNRVGP
jgi:hypothetical protein